MLVSRYRSTYRRVQACSEMGKKRVREGNVMHRRVALYTGGQRDCTQKGSGLCTGG